MTHKFTGKNSTPPTWTHILLRGGRLTKIAGQTVSLSPTLGRILGSASLSALALGATLAHAQPSCTDDGNGNYTCSGSGTLTNALEFTDPQSITITTDFDVEVDDGNAVTITTSVGHSGDVDFIQAEGSSITQNGTAFNEIAISAINEGNGALNITSSGYIRGGDYSITARNGDMSTDLNINVVDVAGAIDARNAGSGALTIVSSGELNGYYGAITARNSSAGTNLIIDMHDTSGSVAADNFGSGVLHITSTGKASSHFGEGIIARNSSAGTDLIIEAADAPGVRAENEGSGALTITTMGSGALEAGGAVYATNSAAGTDLTINTVDAIGNIKGIHAVNEGSGALNINSTGTVSGSEGAGIFASNGANGTDLNIDVVDVERGIHAENMGSGLLSITARGTTNAIDITSHSGGVGTVILEDGSDVAGITDTDGDTAIVLNGGGRLSGMVDLGSGDDSFAFRGSDFSTLSDIDGGDGTDTLKLLAVSSGTFDASILNFEAVELSSGADVSFDMGALETSLLTIESGAVLNATSGFDLTGDLSNHGQINAQDNTADDIITVSGDYAGGGELLVDVDFENDTSDVLEVSGDVTQGASAQTTLISVNDITTGEASGNDIVLVNVAGSTSEGDFALRGGPIYAGAYDYDLTLSGNERAWSLGKEINSTGAAYEGFIQALSSFTSLTSMQQRNGARQWAMGSTEPHGAWLSVKGQSANGTLNSTSNSEFNTRSYALQFGYDLETNLGENGTWSFGVSGLYNNSTTDLTAANGTGSVKSKGYGLGATATWIGDNNIYVDLQGQLARINSDIASEAAGTLTESHGSTAYALSAEIGTRYELTERSAIIPQFQLTLANLDGGAFTDDTGTDVTFASNQSYTGRIGAAYEFDIRKISAIGAKGYVIGNLSQTRGASSNVNVGGDVLTADIDGTWAEVGAGGSFAFGESKAIFAEAAYAKGVRGNSKDSDTLSFSAGLKIDW